MKHTLAVSVEDKPGVMARISGLFSRRGFNIDSLSVGATQEEGISRMTIVVEGDKLRLEQVRKQLSKLINVIKIVDLSNTDFVESELALICVNAKSGRDEVIRIADMFKSKIVDVGAETLTVEVTGGEEKIDAIIRLLEPFGLDEIVRTGKIAMARGAK
jgi:acetolactate synthase-1/3 small subunit